MGELHRQIDAGCVRLVLALTAVAACTPYLVLKVAWVAGSRVGGAPPEIGMATYRLANLVTIALDLVVVGLVLAFVSRRCRRVPAGLVLVPMWVGSGLLAPVTIGVPLGLLAQMLLGGSAVAVDAGLQEWVFALVYGGFVVQAVVLTAAFWLYALDRWSWLGAAAPPSRHPSPVRQLQVTLLVLGVPAAALHGMLFGVWALTGGVPGGDLSALQTVAQRTTYVVRALLAVSAAAGAVALLTRGRSLAALVPAWFGSGYLFAAGVFGGPDTTAGNLLDVVGVGSGLTLAMAGILTVLDDPGPVPVRP